MRSISGGWTGQARALALLISADFRFEWHETKKYDKEVEYDEINYSKCYYVDGKHKNVYNMS